MGDQEAQAKQALKAIKTASEQTVRSAIASAIPVASSQILTVSVPGTVINYKSSSGDFIYNADETIKTPLANRSVARSYLATLDLLMPVEASVSGVIGSENPAPIDGRLKIVRDRYLKAMDYLKSVDDTPGANSRSKLATYILKQESWSKAVKEYSEAQDSAITAVKPGPTATTGEVKAAREAYMQWIQEYGRDFKHAVQAKYMDWVVHGYKFMIDYNFGIVDISSAMKRIENSKEAFRNLTLIADDGDKVENWDVNNKNPTPSEIRAEIRRLKNLLASHITLKEGIDKNAIFPVLSENKTDDDNELKQAYANVYSSMEADNEKILDTPKKGPNTNGPAADSTKPFTDLVKAQSNWNDNSLNRNKNTVRSNLELKKTAAKGWIDKKIKMLEEDIKELELKLPNGGQSGIVALQVVDEKGVNVTDEERRANPALVGRAVPDKPSPWTRVSCRASSTTDIKETETTESASAVAAKLGWGLWRASGGGSNTQSSAKAMLSMSNLSVEISMDCIVVEIDRPWLHAELFSDAELDSGKFDISPGEDKLKAIYETRVAVRAEYQQFSSFPTAFVLAADVELDFSGDTTALESAVSASSFSANVSVGYGPFSVSASHSQSKSSSKTKMQSTATGCKISVQAPQIVGWVQTLLPQLP
ncbi:hypothetical protein MMC14_008206 [Varicellaria rhodocarpa]|nr:hypothetical protein [Varicellaria rhodocarpa]